MSYSRSLGAAVPVMTSPTLIRSTAAPVVKTSVPVQTVTIRPPGTLSPECEDYKYAVTYKPVERTSIVRAGTPVVGARKIKWDPSKAGVDFPQSWLTWRSGPASQAEQVRIDGVTRTQKPGLPETSAALLTAAAKVFMLGVSSLGDGTNAGIQYVGIVSTRDVEMEKMQYFLKGVLRTEQPVQQFPVAYAVVPPLAPGQPAASTAGAFRLAWPERIPGYSVNVARQVAVGSAIAMTEALQIFTTGGIFSSLSVSASQTLFIPGEREVLGALTAIASYASAPGAPAAVQAATDALVQEAQTALSMEPTDGDKLCADVLSRISQVSKSIDTTLGGAISKLSAGVTALPEAQAAAGQWVGNQRRAEEEVKRLVADKIRAFEARSSFTSLTPNEQKAIRCMMQNQAAPLIASRSAAVEPRVQAITGINTSDFNTAAMTATQAYQQALTESMDILSKATARVEKIREQIALDWYARDFRGLPVWMWGAGGAAVLLGGAVAVRHFRNK